MKRHPLAAVALLSCALMWATAVDRPSAELAIVPAVAEPPTATDPATTTTSVLPPIVGPATVDTLAISVRVSPPETRPPVPPCDNPFGLYCLPFAPDGLDRCAEMNFYRIQFNLPERFSDQPRIPVVSFARQGLGWRESNCNNHAAPQTKAGRCCKGYWAIAISNRTAPGYRQGFLDCGVYSSYDIYGDLPLQKQKNACVAAVLWRVYVAGGSADPWRI